MSDRILVGNRTLKIGDILVATERAREQGMCATGSIVSVSRFTREDGELLVGLASEKPLSGWGDLHGSVEENHGLWVTTKCVLDNFRPMEDTFVIKDWTFKNKDLSGMECVILHSKKDHAFIELKENVGGGGADGTGKMGHCIIINTSHLKFGGRTILEWQPDTGEIYV
jgi:hypothetical protein